MAKQPAPMSMCAKVSQRAQQIAGQKMKGYGWSDKTISAIQPMPGEGKIGLRTTARYLMYQEKGIKPFIMWWVDGRKVPIRGRGGGGTHIVTGKDPGQPGYVNIPHVGRVWRDQKWRHPGLQPKNFMLEALRQSVKELRPSARKMLMDELRKAAK